MNEESKTILINRVHLLKKRANDAQKLFENDKRGLNIVLSPILDEIDFLENFTIALNKKI